MRSSRRSTPRRQSEAPSTDSSRHPHRRATCIAEHGLTISAANGLVAFELEKSGSTTTGSTLTSIDTSTALATTMGGMLSARDIRGAAFDSSGALWAIDSASDELIQSDPTSGLLIGSAINLMLGSMPFAASFAPRADSGTHHRLVSFPNGLPPVQALEQMGVHSLQYVDKSTIVASVSTEVTQGGQGLGSLRPNNRRAVETRLPGGGAGNAGSVEVRPVHPSEKIDDRVAEIFAGGSDRGGPSTTLVVPRTPT